MNDNQHSSKFWIGNGIMAVALLMLLNMGALWESMGVMAMALWVILVGVGTYLLMTDKRNPSNSD